MDPNQYPSSSPVDQHGNDAGADDGIKPRLPKVGDIFESWDDFRQWSRRGAEARGFTLSQSQSKGSSGTIVLRCSRFKEPGTAGQKMAENGCEVVFKVMKAKNGYEGFEVVQAYEEHNHPYGPNIPTGHRAGAAQTGLQPKRKKVKSAGGDSAPLAGPSHTRQPSGAAPTPPPAGPKPFLFDPYTGKPLRSSNTPVPSASTPSPPSHLDPAHYSAQPAPPSAHPPSRAPSSAGAPTYQAPYTARPTAYAHASAPAPQEPAAAPVARVAKRSAPVSVPVANALKAYPPLSIRLSVKAQNSITEFLGSISPALAAYGAHFMWLGVRTPVDLLEVVEGGGEDELEMLLDEIDTCGIGGKGEGVAEDEKVLIIRGLRKLKALRNKS